MLADLFSSFKKVSELCNQNLLLAFQLVINRKLEAFLAVGDGDDNLFQKLILW